MNIERIFDLKGSTIGRKVDLSEREIEQGSSLKVLKDLNFIELGIKLDIPKKAKDDLLLYIERDA